MYELLYISVSPKELSESELMDILNVAQLKNKSIGITGMLVYHNREIMQILEGEEAVVKELFQSIYMDNRHTGIDVFYQGNIENRSFGEWSMAFIQFDEENINTLTDGFEVLDKSKSPMSLVKNNPNRGKKMFLSLRDKI